MTNKELTPQEICEELNAWDGGNGWDARSDWTPLGYATAYPRIGGRIPHIFSAGETDAPARFIAESDSRALIAGWKAAEDLAKLKMVWEPDLNRRAYAALDEVDELKASTPATDNCQHCGEDLARHHHRNLRCPTGETVFRAHPTPPRAVGTGVDLEAIETRCSAVIAPTGRERQLIREDIPALIAEVRRLAKGLARADECIVAFEKVTAERMQAELAAAREERNLAKIRTRWQEKLVEQRDAELAALRATPPAPETIAQLFHEAYERLAPSFSYETRKASAVPWSDVPAQNKALMIAVAGEVSAALRAGAGPGTWAWASARLDAGYAVRRASQRIFLLKPTPARVLRGRNLYRAAFQVVPDNTWGWQPMVGDFDATDWQIVEDPIGEE